MVAIVTNKRRHIQVIQGRHLHIPSEGCIHPPWEALLQSTTLLSLTHGMTQTCKPLLTLRQLVKTRFDLIVKKKMEAYFKRLITSSLHSHYTCVDHVPAWCSFQDWAWMHTQLQAINPAQTLETSRSKQTVDNECPSPSLNIVPWHATPYGGTQQTTQLNPCLLTQWRACSAFSIHLNTSRQMTIKGLFVPQGNMTYQVMIETLHISFQW